MPRLNSLLNQANPDPGFTWYHPRGRELDFDYLKKYSMSVQPEKDKITLAIFNLGLEDTGEYIFSIEVMGKTDEERLEKNISLVVKYHQEPMVSLAVDTNTSGLILPDGSDNNKHDLKVFGQEYNLSCVAEGYPIDVNSTQWTFRQCRSYTDCSPAIPVPYDSFAATDGNVNDAYHYRYKSRLRVTAAKSGIFTCRTCTRKEFREAACNQSSVEFFVSEYENAFHVEGPKNNSVQKDRVELVCAASVYQHKSVAWFRKIGKMWKRMVSAASVRIVENVTEFSIVSKVIFSEIEIRDSGMYECRTDHGGKEEKKEVGITVLKIIPPSKGAGNNMNNTEVTLGLGKSLELNCSARGRPTPRIIWRKDGEILSANSSAEATSSCQNCESAIEWSDDGQMMVIRYLVFMHSGTYSCEAVNTGGKFKGTLRVAVHASHPVSTGLIAGIVVGAVILVIISGVLCWKVKIYNRKFKELTQAELMLFETGDPKSINPELGLDDQVDLLPYEREYEFDRNKLKLGRQLGAGAFGRVLKGEAFGIVPWERSTVVAVKMVKPHADITYIKALMAELKIMIHLGKHINILNLLGACTKSLNKRELLVIVEYCRFGNIQKYLLLHRNHYIDQVDPANGEINFQIGQDMMDGQDLAKAREEDEMSTAYARRRSSGLTTLNTAGTATNGELAAGAIANPAFNRMDGYIDTSAAAGGNRAAEAVAALGARGAEPATCGGGDTCTPQQNQPTARQMSVRYIADPAMHARMPKKKRQEWDSSY